MKLIIGKNSAIISEIKDKLNDFDFKSHTEISSTNLDVYDFIFLFSWSHANNLENVDIISRLPSEKLVFISSTAVFATAIRDQWASYPRKKLESENAVLGKGGSVLRIGVWDKNLKDKIYGTYQQTTKEMLIHELNNWNNAAPKVRNLYLLDEGSLPYRKAWLGRVFRKISLALPPAMVFQAPFVLIGRCLGVSNYGYTGDAISCCQKVLQIGYGAFGGYLYREMQPQIDMVVYSRDNNIILNGNGFNGTLIGKNGYGLSKDWHGVFIKKCGEIWKKNIIWRKRNKRLPKWARIEANVSSISYDGSHFRCGIDVGSQIIHDYYGKKTPNLKNEFEICCTKLVLSAGPIENARLLNTIEKFDIKFDDHELALLGEVDFVEIKDKYISRFGPFSKNRSSCVVKLGETEMLLDFRPFVTAKKLDSLAFYNTNSVNIIVKLMSQFNLERLNEAIYNRFKVCFATKRYQVYGQLLVKDCISYDGVHGLSRKRVSEEDWNNLSKSLKHTFWSFRCYKVTKTIDSLHTWSSQSFSGCSKINKLLSDGLLFVFGSPNPNLNLSSRHHTHEFRVACLMELRERGGLVGSKII